MTNIFSAIFPQTQYIQFTQIPVTPTQFINKHPQIYKNTQAQITTPQTNTTRIYYTPLNQVNIQNVLPITKQETKIKSQKMKMLVLPKN